MSDAERGESVEEKLQDGAIAPPLEHSAIEEPAAPAGPELPPSPGGAIRKAREQVEMSLEELAAHTKLARTTLDALEADRFEDLSESVYVRGYYRKCAKVLDLDGERLIAGYEARASAMMANVPPAKVLLAGSNPAEPRGTGRTVIAVLVVIAAVVGVLWWVQQDRPSSDTPPALVTPPVSGRDGPVEPPPVRRPALVLESQLGSPSVSNEEAAEGALATEPETAPVPAAPAEANVPSPQTEPVETNDAPAAGSERAEPSADAPAVAAPTLVLRFKENSWVRVEDARGQSLASGLISSGSVRELRGVAPYTVFLGFAPGVDVSLDGQAVDLGPHTRSNDTARLTLP